MMLLVDVLQIAALELLFVLCGFGLISPFRNNVGLRLPAAMLAGLLSLTFCSLTLQVVLHAKFSVAIAISAFCLIALTLLTMKQQRISLLASPGWATVAVTAGLCVVSCLTILRLEAEHGTYVLTYYSGTDQFGYAHLADWITGAPTNVLLEADPAAPWDSWVQLMVTVDPRFGSISYLAIVSTLTGRTGMFSYNIACVVALIACSVSLAGLFTKNVLIFVLVAVALFFSAWFSIGEAGFFGKLLGYPDTLFAAGLLVLMLAEQDCHPDNLMKAFSAALFCVCATVCFSALATATLALAIGGAFVAADYVWRLRSADQVFRSILIVGAMVAVSLVASGIVARPIYPPTSISETSWAELWDVVSQVVTPDRNLGFSPAILGPMLAGVVTLCVGLVILAAFKARSPRAIALAAGASSLALLLLLSGKKWELYQSATVYLPAIILACGALADEPDGRLGRPSLAALLVIIVACGLGRVLATVSHSVGADRTPRYVVLASVIEAVVSGAKNGPVLIDTPDVYTTYPLVLAMHRGGVPFQLSAQAWRSFLGYRKWDPPQPHDIGTTIRVSPDPEAFLQYEMFQSGQ